MTVAENEQRDSKCYSIGEFEVESNSSLAFDDNTRCGWNKCKPNRLQKLNTPKWFLFFLVCYSAAQGKVERHLLCDFLHISLTSIGFSQSSVTGMWMEIRFWALAISWFLTFVVFVRNQATRSFKTSCRLLRFFKHIEEMYTHRQMTSSGEWMVG